MMAISNLFIMHDVIFNILFRYDEIATAARNAGVY